MVKNKLFDKDIKNFIKGIICVIIAMASFLFLLYDKNHEGFINWVSLFIFVAFTVSISLKLISKKGFIGKYAKGLFAHSLLLLFISIISSLFYSYYPIKSIPQNTINTYIFICFIFIIFSLVAILSFIFWFLGGIMKYYGKDYF